MKMADDNEDPKDVSILMDKREDIVQETTDEDSDNVSILMEEIETLVNEEGLNRSSDHLRDRCRNNICDILEELHQDCSENESSRSDNTSCSVTEYELLQKLRHRCLEEIERKRAKRIQHRNNL